MTRDPRKVSENAIHLAVVDALRFFAAPGVVWFHVANQRRCTPKEGAFLKRMGVRAGVADFVIIIPPKLMHPASLPSIAFLELKSTKGRHSLDQRIFRADVKDIGCLYAEPRSVDEALDILTSWGALKGMARSSISPAAKAKRAA